MKTEKIDPINDEKFEMALYVSSAKSDKCEIREVRLHTFWLGNIDRFANADEIESGPHVCLQMNSKYTHYF